MFTDYVYNSNGFLTDILHKSGSSGPVKEGFSYLYDDVQNITRITHEDGSYWTYTYDNRYRLTSAVRHNAADKVRANYAYAYDNGDNMTSKTEPWVDDFADGSLAGNWNVTGSWAASGKEARRTNPAASNEWFIRSTTDANLEVRFEYENYNDASLGNALTVDLRRNGNDRLILETRGDRM